MATGETPAQELNIGDPAPPLMVQEFVKGTPVTTLDSGSVYVIEFWATWCVPCKAVIPHLTRLQEKYPAVNIIGVSIWEHQPQAVRPFVAEMGAMMQYGVALDKVPEGEPGNQGTMATTWMKAAGQNGIPAAFLVNRAGRIAWIGHPLSLEKPLTEVLAGTWNLQTEAARFKKEVAQQRKMDAIGQKFSDARKTGDWKKALAVLDQAIAEDPDLEPMLANARYSGLTAMGDIGAAVAYGTRLVEVVFASNAMALNSMAWNLVDPTRNKPATSLERALALRAARQADELTEGKDGAIADTLAKAYFDNDDIQMAILTQERAISLAQGTEMANDPELYQRLEIYRGAAADRQESV